MKIIHITSRGQLKRRAADKEFDRRSAEEKADDERYENLMVHFHDEEKRKLYRPPWRDTEAVISLFREEELHEWLSDFPGFLDPFEEAVERAVEKAKKEGDFSDLIRMAMEGPPKKKPGRPRNPADRVRRYPIHKATYMVPEAEWTLRYVYPEPPDKEIRANAILAVEYMTGVDGERIRRQLARHDRQRLA